MSNLKAIAESAGVSVSTVSSVLNGKHTARHPGARARAERIREIAQQMNYRPHAAAQSMRRGRFHAVALVTDAVTERTALPRELLCGISGALSARDEGLAFTELPDERIGSTGYLPNLLQRASVDGVLVNYHGVLPLGFERQLLETGLPAVWLNATRDTNTISPDDYKGAMRGTRECLAAGHTRVAYLDRDFYRIRRQKRHASRDDRLSGYRAAMEQAGLPSRLLAIDPAHDSHEDAISWYMDLLSKPDAPTAVVCYGADVDTLLYAAQLAGLRFPDDLSVLVFADRPQRYGVQMATMVLPWEEIAHAAVGMLMGGIESEQSDQPAILLPLHFEPGTSIRPPRREPT